MRKRDYLLFIFVIVNIVITSMFVFCMPKKENPYVRIMIDHEIYGQYELHTDKVIHVNDTNVCVIENGKVYMKEANCPDRLCVHSKAIDEKGGSIVCLPNKVVLEVISNNRDIDTMT